MKAQTISRRGLLKASSASLGGFLLASPVAMASRWLSNKDELCEMIYQNVPGTRAHQQHVERFVEDLLHNRIEQLEDQDFIERESKKIDREKLERFVVMQYMTSTNYIEAVSR